MTGKTERWELVTWQLLTRMFSTRVYWGPTMFSPLPLSWRCPIGKTIASLEHIHGPVSFPSLSHVRLARMLHDRDYSPWFIRVQLRFWKEGNLPKVTQKNLWCYVVFLPSTYFRQELTCWHSESYCLVQEKSTFPKGKVACCVKQDRGSRDTFGKLTWQFPIGRTGCCWDGPGQRPGP